MENTLEALKHLIKEDKQRRVADLHYVEFDVHVRIYTSPSTAKSTSILHSFKVDYRLLKEGNTDCLLDSRC